MIVNSSRPVTATLEGLKPTSASVASSDRRGCMIIGYHSHNACS